MRLIILTLAFLSLSAVVDAQTASLEGQQHGASALSAPLQRPDYAQTEEPEPSTSDPWLRPLAFELQTAIHGPVGVAGVVLEYAPIKNLALLVGGGASIWGWRAAAGVRAQFPVTPRSALGAELWLSAGPVEELCLLCDRETADYERALYLQPGVSYELRFLSGFRLRLFAGLKRILAHSALSSSESCAAECRPDNLRITGYGGAAIGYTFGGT